MSRIGERKGPDCELLLFLFSAGALTAVLCRERAEELMDAFPGISSNWDVFLLAVDAAMAASLLAWYVMPPLTLAFGAVAAIKAQELFDLGLRDGWRTLLPLVLITPLHFLICVWSLRLSAELRGLLREKGEGRAPCLISLLLTVCACTVCILLKLFRIQMQI